MNDSSLPSKEFVLEATVFWLIVTAFIIVVTSLPHPDMIASFGYVVAGIYLIVAYLCWKSIRVAFITTVILGVITIGGTVALDFSALLAIFVHVTASLLAYPAASSDFLWLQGIQRGTQASDAQLVTNGQKYWREVAS